MRSISHSPAAKASRRCGLLTATTTLQAIAYKSGMTDSSVTSGAYTIQQPVAAPTFNPAAGTYTAAQSVTIGTATSGATIRYTTDGTTPSATVGTLYSAVAGLLNLMAIADVWARTTRGDPTHVAEPTNKTPAAHTDSQSASPGDAFGSPSTGGGSA